jgi:hypothetical protein
MDKIQIGIACGSNSELYVNFLMDTIKKTVDNTDNIEFLLGVNKPSVDKELLQKNNDVFNIKIIDAISPRQGSLGHGFCLDELLKHMDSKYGMFVDCDVAFLEKDWDEKLKDCLKDNIAVVGADTDPKHNHYKKFPFIIMVMFLTDVIKKQGISFMPKHEHICLDENNCHLFNESVGVTIHLDTGWELPYKLKSSGYDGLPLPMISPRLDKEKIVFMTEEMRGEEHHLNDIPIFTHVGRSSARNFLHDPIIQRWRQRVKEWFDERHVAN